MSHDYRIQPSSERYLRPYGSRCERALLLDGSSAAQTGRAIRIIDGHNRVELHCAWAPATGGNLRLDELRVDPESPGTLWAALRDTVAFAALGAVRVYEIPDDGPMLRVDADSVTWPAVIPATIDATIAGVLPAAGGTWVITINGTPFALMPAPGTLGPAIATALAALINADPNFPAVAVGNVITVTPTVPIVSAIDSSIAGALIDPIVITPASGGGSPVPVLLTSWRQE